MHALKGQKPLAQGNALGIRMNIKVRPERAKALDVGSFCPFYYICTWKNKEVKIFISANFC